jgi:hypothetical protein
LAPEAPEAVEQQLLDTIRLWLIMLALHIPVYSFWGWLLFQHWDDFWNAIAFWKRPQLDFCRFYASRTMVQRKHWGNAQTPADMNY